MAQPARPRISLREMLLHVLRERDAERTHVSRMLHDDVGQVLSAVGLHLDVLRLDLKDRVPEIAGRTSEIQQILESAVQQVRKLSYQLCPEPVGRSGLGVALRHLAGRRKELFPGVLTADCDDPANLPEPVASALFRIAEQSLDNAIRHAQAGVIRLVLRSGVRRTTLEVRDNGRGFDVDQSRSRPKGVGLMLMENCAREAGLKLSLAVLPGRYTIVKAVHKPKPKGEARNGRRRI